MTMLQGKSVLLFGADTARRKAQAERLSAALNLPSAETLPTDSACVWYGALADQHSAIELDHALAQQGQPIALALWLEGDDWPVSENAIAEHFQQDGRLARVRLLGGIDLIHPALLRQVAIAAEPMPERWLPPKPEPRKPAVSAAASTTIANKPVSKPSERDPATTDSVTDTAPAWKRGRAGRKGAGLKRR